MEYKYNCATCKKEWKKIYQRPPVLYKCICGSTNVTITPSNHFSAQKTSAIGYSRPPRNPVRTDTNRYFYLYLEYPEYVQTWINGGGPVPINIASAYKSEKREGTQTPDENLIHESEQDISRIVPFFFENGAENVSFINFKVNGKIVQDTKSASYFSEDGRILCFSTKRSKEIGSRLNKRYCVEIQDMQVLKRLIDEQNDLESVAGHCEYRTDHQRNHFTKGSDDAWMHEFRLFWPTTKELRFMLPPGIAKEVDL